MRNHPEPAILLPLALGFTIGKLKVGSVKLGAVTGTLLAGVDAARSRVPTLGYTIPYAVGNTLLTIWGTVIVVLLS